MILANAKNTPRKHHYHDQGGLLLTLAPNSSKMEPMKYIPRLLEKALRHHLSRGKSILLLGPRQTGKTTLLDRINSDWTLSLVPSANRLRYERDPALLSAEIELLQKRIKKSPLVVMDEIQKVPSLMDTIQDMIDRKQAQFLLTGSSARKLRRNSSVNLLPGRLVTLHLDPLVHQEIPEASLETLLLQGSLPGIFTLNDKSDAEADLRSYVEAYLEEEVRAEALVRQMGPFARFLELAGLESGKIVSFRAMSRDLGVSHTTIASYFEILEDCLVAERVDPVTRSTTRKKLSKSSRYLIFDLGVRRLCTGEGTRLTPTRMGELFEQWVGLELIRYGRLDGNARTRYWRDLDGAEVDWVLEKHRSYTPIEVKWSEAPSQRDARHVETFIKEYPEARRGFIVCRTPRPFAASEHVTAIPWQDLPSLFE